MQTKQEKTKPRLADFYFLLNYFLTLIFYLLEILFSILIFFSFFLSFSFFFKKNKVTTNISLRNTAATSSRTNPADIKLSYASGSDLLFDLKVEDLGGVAPGAAIVIQATKVVFSILPNAEASSCDIVADSKEGRFEYDNVKLGSFEIGSEPAPDALPERITISMSFYPFCFMMYLRCSKLEAITLPAGGRWAQVARDLNAQASPWAVWRAKTLWC